MTQQSTTVRVKELMTSRTILVYLALALFVIGGGLVMPQSLGARSVQTVIREASLLGIVALGQGIVMLSGGLDISVGNTMFSVIVLGGKVGDMVRDVIQVYDTTTGTWADSDVVLPVPMNAFAAGVIGDDLIIADGNLSGDSINLTNRAFKIDIGLLLPADSPVITDMERGSLAITFTGGSQTYKVESSTDPYDYVQTNMTWGVEATGLAPGTWTDVAVPASGDDYRPGAPGAAGGAGQAGKVGALGRLIDWE